MIVEITLYRRPRGPPQPLRSGLDCYIRLTPERAGSYPARLFFDGGLFNAGQRRRGVLRLADSTVAEKFRDKQFFLVLGIIVGECVYVGE